MGSTLEVGSTLEFVLGFYKSPEWLEGHAARFFTADFALHRLIGNRRIPRRIQSDVFQAAKQGAFQPIPNHWAFSHGFERSANASTPHVKSFAHNPIELSPLISPFCHCAAAIKS